MPGPRRISNVPAIARWLVAAAVVTMPMSAVAQDAATAGAGQYGASVLPLEGSVIGQSIALIDVQVATSSGNAERDDAAVRAARAATGVLVGRAYRPVLVDTALEGLVRDGILAGADHRPAYDGARAALRIVVLLDVSDAVVQVEADAPEPGFPVIYEDERSKLTLILSAGAGAYYDINPWFGAPDLFNEFSPLAGNLPGDETGWGEGYLEFGIGGATQLAESDFYLFGAVSAIFSASRGQDIFTDDDRNFVQIEKGYAGLLYANRDTGNSTQLSFGRQTWTLNDGFLISMIAGSSNAGERGATYLGPRNATDFSALLTGEFGRVNFALFYIDPNELEDLESNTTFAGANVGYRVTEALSVDASLIVIPQWDSTYRTPSGEALKREGTTTYGVHALYRPTTPDHPWLAGEYYRQTNSAYDMSADAWYGTVGYIGNSLPWSPSLSYRYASFSGDDPQTERFERFDSLMSTGLGNWLQGISFGKVYRNANLNTHRIQANVAPRPGMNLTFTYHKLMADERNNLGANPALSQLSSRDIGEEYTLALRWAVNRNAYLQLVGSYARPGRALRDVGANDPWSTLQASLYISF